MANEKKTAVFINAQRTGYGPDQVRKTATVEELIDMLQEMGDAYGYDAEVFLSHDSGYTYGGITYDDIEIAQYDSDRVYLGEDVDCW